VNEDKFLSDTTGNRRWLVFKVLKIDYMHKVDVDKMWAQVYYLWKSGFKHWFDIEEIKKINDINEEFRSMSTEEELLLKCFKFINFNESGEGEFYTSTDVMLEIAKDKPTLMSKMNSRTMGKALSKHVNNPVNRKLSNGTTKYYLEKVQFESVDNTKQPELKEEEIKDVTDLVNNNPDLEVPF